MDIKEIIDSKDTFCIKCEAFDTWKSLLKDIEILTNILWVSDNKPTKELDTWRIHKDKTYLVVRDNPYNYGKRVLKYSEEGYVTRNKSKYVMIDGVSLLKRSNLYEW